MRNFFEQELRKLFEDEEMIRSPQFSGRACLGTLERDVRVKAEFVSTKIADEYDALRITVLNRKEGVIDNTTLRIVDMIGRKKIPSNPYFQDGMSPHIWTDCGQHEWYAYTPDVSDYIAMRQEVARYLEPFRERTPERSHHIQREGRGKMDSQQKELLQKRLEENYAIYLSQLAKMSFADLIELAPEIAAARVVCDELQTSCSEQEAAVLLQFDDPLEVVRDQWLEEEKVSHDQEMDHVLWNILDKADDLLAEYAPARQQAIPARPQMQLEGKDGNIFVIMGRASMLLNEAGQREQIDEMFQRVSSCGSYEAALNIVSEYVETELSSAIQTQKTKPKKEKKAHER